MAPTDAVLLSLYMVGALFVLAVYIEEIVFIRRHFTESADRRRRTIWLLALFPV